MASARIASDRKMRGFPKSGSPRIVSNLLASDTKRHIFRTTSGCCPMFAATSGVVAKSYSIPEIGITRNAVPENASEKPVAELESPPSLLNWN